MSDWCFSLGVVLFLIGGGVSEVTPGPECGDSRIAGLSMHSKINSTGEWLTFSALTNYDSHYNVSVDVKQRVVECGGKKTIHVYGFLRGYPDSYLAEKLSFHHKCGKNVALINKGLSAKKLNAEERLDAVVLTNRPLKSGELFEVRLDKKGSKFGFLNGIGATIHSTEEAKLLYHLNSVSTGTWTLYGKSIWRNGSVVYNEYLPINDLQVGDRLGVMRSTTGALHFFVNGKDYGPGVSNIPEGVYGAFDMYGDALEVTIMDTLSNISP